VLAALAASCIGAAPSRAAVGAHATGSDVAVVDALVQLLPEPSGAARLGWRYLAARDSLSDSRALGRELLATPAARRAFLDATGDKRRRIIEACVAEDFAASRIAEVDGWVLAETEAILCAVVATALG
jgi:hypothetical protein